MHLLENSSLEQFWRIAKRIWNNYFISYVLCSEAVMGLTHSDLGYITETPLQCSCFVSDHRAFLYQLAYLMHLPFQCACSCASKIKRSQSIHILLPSKPISFPLYVNYGLQQCLLLLNCSCFVLLLEVIVYSEHSSLQFRYTPVYLIWISFRQSNQAHWIQLKFVKLKHSAVVRGGDVPVCREPEDEVRDFIKISYLVFFV